MLPPWLFHHNNLFETMASAHCIDKKKLTNAINYLHFKEDHLYVLLKHPRYEEGVLVKALPEPCLGEELVCRWEEAYSAYNLEHYHFQYLIISHDQSILLVPARIFTANSSGLTIQLPEQSFVISHRRAPRFSCQGVKAELWQNGFQAEGVLMDFGPSAFRISVQSDSPSSFQWFNVDAPATIHLSGGKEVFYSGNCNCMYQKQDGRSREIILTPTQDQIQRFKAKTLRNPRRQSSLSLYALFEHPFIKKKVQREIFDISTAGFSIREQPDETVLIPGLIIPDMTISYAGILKIPCKAQVIYRKEGEDQVRFGLVILDMDLKNYHILNQLLNNLPGTDQGMINEVDPDQLWKLFFDSNFIYPEKYKHIQTYRTDFQKTYRKVYQEAPQIAKYFTYQKNGRIYSHISLIRAYEQTWMAHHHAARAAEGRHTGFIVLKQMICYLNDMHRFPSAHMDYCMCYYRPGNRFTDRIYSGFAREKSDPAVCSIDTFAHLTYETKNDTSPLPEGWFVRACSASDLWEFGQFYKHQSGGLLSNVLSLGHPPPDDSLEQVYARMGLTRRWKAYALHRADVLKAILIAEESDAAINLSDLLSGFKIFVIDPGIPPKVILSALGSMTKEHSMKSLPLLIYPADYAQNADLYSEKQYLLWVLDAKAGFSSFIEYLGRRFRIKFV